MNDPARPRSRRSRGVIAAGMLALAIGFIALGIWQLYRREWKHALIAAVDARIHAAPVPAPGAAAWPTLSAEKDAYRRVRITGRLRNDREALVKAVTDAGAGYWVLTPLEAQGFTVLINRGFVPPERRSSSTRAAGNVTGPVTITGLLRFSEPHGGFLRSNDPAHDRWYSRDVAAIASKRQLANAAPYFIDADATPNPGGYPVGGLTVVHFSDNHLGYALTWFALAGLALFGGWRVLSDKQVKTGA